MPYGSGRRYNRLSKDVSVPPSAIPTFVCERCQKVKSTAAPFLELTALVNSKILLYNKLCDDCAKALQEWLKGK